jgi:hypothetical protein
LISLAVLVAFGMIAVVGVLDSPSFRYRVLGDKTQLRIILARHLRNGDSLERVESYLGVSQHHPQGGWISAELEDTTDERYQVLFQPDGLTHFDTLAYYPDLLAPDYGGDREWLLHFRGGKLINLPEAWLREHYGTSNTWTNGPPVLSRFDR